MIAGLLSFTESKAQVGWKRLSIAAGDTISTSASLDTVQKYVSLTAGYSSTSIKVKYTKISGTVALKAYIYPGDGTDYDTAPSDSSAAFGSTSSWVRFDKYATSLAPSHFRIEVRAANGAVSTQAVKIEVFYFPKGYKQE